MQTAKSLQLMDDNGINISPITNIESIYYEVTENNVVYRKFLYDNFPVYTNFNADVIEHSYVNTGNQPLEVGYYDTVKANVNSTLEDIIISSVTVNKLEGTAYNSLNIENYNLTKILYNYAPKYWVNENIKKVLNTSLTNTISAFHSSLDALTLKLNTSINDAISTNNLRFSYIDASLNNLTSRVSDISTYRLNVSTYSRANLTSYANAKLLTPGKLYYLGYTAADDYYSTTLGGAAVSGKQLYLGLIADTSSSFSNKVFACFERNNAAFGAKHNWDVEFDLSKYMITKLKDEFGNEAPFNFKQIKQSGGKFLFNYGTTDFSTTGKCKNNKVESYDIIWFNVNNNTGIVKNNYIGAGNINVTINCQYNIDNIIINSSNANIQITNSKDITIGNNNTNVKIINNNSNTIMSNTQDISINNTGSNTLIGNNIIENNCKRIILQNSSNNIINASCYNVSLYQSTATTIYQDCQLIYNTFPLTDVTIMQRCNNIKSTTKPITGVVVGPNYTNLSITADNTYYTYQRLIARSFERL